MSEEPANPDPIRDFYELWPHPAQPPDLDAFRDRRRVPRGSASSSFHFYWPTRPYTTDLDILFAGCGTTQAVESALWDREARIVAVDVSKACLDQTAQLAKRYGVTNIELHHLPLEQISTLGRDFDLIFCTGVLHHLADPDAGLRSLRNVLRRDGAMLLMVYGRYGRLGVYMFQEYCRRLGIEPTATHLAELSHVFPRLTADHPQTPCYQRLPDFATPNGVADLFVNPRDRAYTVAEIYEWLARGNMSFHRWFYQAMYVPQCCGLALTPHMDRVLRLPEPEQHAVVELFRGNLNTHTFIACRDDRPVESYQIRFDTPDWQSLIPVALPTLGAYAVNDRPGIVGQIACSGHDFPVTEFLLTAPDFATLQLLDGKRTLGQIAAASPLRDPQTQTRDLYQRLWSYDQIMFRRPV